MFNKIHERVYKKRKVTLATGLGFGVTDFIGGGGQAVIGAWLLFFYTTYCNLSATQGALIVGIGKIVSAVGGMVIGGFSDNFYRTKLGKYFGRRHFFLYFGAPLMFTFTLMWIGHMNFWYYLLIYCAFDFVTMIMIPYETLPTEMTDVYEERTKLSTCRMFFSSIATSLATFIPGQLFKVMGTNSTIPFFVNGLIFGIIFCLALWTTAWSTWELPINKITVDSSSNTKRRSPMQALKEDCLAYFFTFKVKSFRQHLMIYLFSFTGKDVVNTVFAFFCIYILGISATDAANLMSMSIVGIVVTLVGGYLINKVSPKSLYYLSYACCLLMLAAYFAASKAGMRNMSILFIVALIYQIGTSLLGFVPWQVYPFIPDVDEIVCGENRAGTLASVMSLLRNSTAAIATVLVGMFLDAHGFVKGAHVQPADGKTAILEAMFIGGGGLIVLALIVVAQFKLNKKTHAVIVAETKRLREGGSKKDATEETKKVVKELTGYDYSRVWPASPDTVNPAIDPRKEK